MRINEIMSRDVETARPQDTIQDVARKMREIDSGVIPVCDGDKVQGMVTDRDIVIRAVSEARSFDTPVTDVMTADVEYCYEDDDITAAADKMAELQVRRLIVLDHDQRLVGIVSLGDIAQQGKDKTTGQALEEISEPNRH
ncbi:CBS domain-containing protein [Phenylobacterium sp. J426]|uniref:CBS domain-containing protein n=1 Tax=Phenylobacterium sp. J426 TaxID=2898439 RepID=UPI002151BD52|nr:CBS domain-containing protein [Phenylobacterium sp. J426]MCR5872939.1 CBS domain-containing protein [Phenylobacterium sp. J426]